MNNFKAGALIMRGSERLRVSCIRPEVAQIVLEGARGEQFILSNDDFNNGVAGGEYIPAYSGNVAEIINVPKRHLNSSEFAQLNWRIELLKVFEDEREQGTSCAESSTKLREYCAKQGVRMPTLRTLQRWVKRRNESQSKEELAPLFSRRGRKIKVFEEDEYEEIIMDEIIKRYCGSDKFNLGKVTSFANNRCRRHAEEKGVPFRGISRRSINRRIKSLSYRLIAPGQVDKETFNQEMRSAIKRLVVDRPYERVEMDANFLKIFCADENGVLIGRPVLYAALDSATSAPIIISLSIQKPSQDFVLKALHFAFTPKGEAFTKKYGLRNDWLAPAGIERVVLDNAVEHHGGLILNTIRYLGITIDYPQAGKPQRKPYIERFFGTLESQLISACPGSAISQSEIETDPTGKAMKQCLMTLEQLETKIIKWVADVYMQRPLERLEDRYGKGCSPAMAMELLKKKYCVMPPPDPQLFRDSCMRYSSKKTTLTREGVRCSGEGFHSQALSALYQELGLSQKVEVRYNPLDCSSVSVVNPRDQQQLIEAFNKRVGMPRMTFADAQAVRRRLGRSDAEVSGEQYHKDYVEQLNELDELSKSKKVSDRNRAKRKQDQWAQGRVDAAVLGPPESHQTVHTETLTAAPRRKKEVNQ